MTIFVDVKSVGLSTTSQNLNFSETGVISVYFALKRGLAMFKVLRDTADNYSVYCYNYDVDNNKYNFVYSARNLVYEDVACLLQSRVKHQDDLEWIPDILRLTNQSAMITDDGLLVTVPVAETKGTYGREKKDTTG